jgi:hypothetical protein
MYWPSEGCIMMWYDKPTGDCCLCKKCCLGEQWSSDIAVSRTLAKHSDRQGENTRFQTLWFSPLTRMSSDIADSSLLPLLYRRSLSILSGCPVINVRSCLQDTKLLWIGPMAYHPLTGLHYCKILNYMCHDYGSCSTISGMDLCGSGYRQVFNWLRC